MQTEVIKAARKLRTSALVRGRPVEFKARGGSMTPTIVDGDSILICPNTKLQVGDIVLMRFDHGYIAHRLVKISGEMVITKGDFMTSEDPPAGIEDVMGNVVLIKRGSYLRRSYYLVKAYAGMIMRRLKSRLT